jgi:hypothetical protein
MKTAKFRRLTLIVVILFILVLSIYSYGFENNEVFKGKVSTLKIPIYYNEKAKKSIEVESLKCISIDENNNCTISGENDKINFLQINIRNVEVTDSKYELDLKITAKEKTNNKILFIEEEKVSNNAENSDSINIQIAKEISLPGKSSEYEFTVLCGNNLIKN